jgi:hypothetical protein
MPDRDGLTSDSSPHLPHRGHQQNVKIDPGFSLLFIHFRGRSDSLRGLAVPIDRSIYRLSTWVSMD